MQVTHLSRLYESAPAYVTDQPTFINGALAATTEHEPFKLLDTLKEIEVGAQQLKSAGPSCPGPALQNRLQAQWSTTLGCLPA